MDGAGRNASQSERCNVLRLTATGRVCSPSEKRETLWEGSFSELHFGPHVKYLN
jgi:hypothetical protein